MFSHFNNALDIWVHSDTPEAVHVLLNYKYKGTNLNDLIANCPGTSELIGWVKYQGMLNVERSKHVEPPFTFTFETQSDAPTDWRVSFF